PLQEGNFPFPVKYGYSAVGTVELGPKDLIKLEVFCLHPHQDVFQAPAAMAIPLPEGLPPRRATLAANMETALNALWDSGAGPADRITVVGAGIVGLLVAYLAARLPGAEVTVIDPVADRRSLVELFGAQFATPIAAASPSSSRGADRGGGKQLGGARMLPADVVFHTSAREPGLATAIAAAGFEATIVEMSWYGDKHIAVPLGGPFHSQ
ncbi:unnamed protein product, partial [Phaeothamnion confervicola]